MGGPQVSSRHDHQEWLMASSPPTSEHLSPRRAGAVRDRARCQDSPKWEERGLRPPLVLGDTELGNAEPGARTEGTQGPRSMGGASRAVGVLKGREGPTLEQEQEECGGQAVCWKGRWAMGWRGDCRGRRQMRKQMRGCRLGPSAAQRTQANGNWALRALG